MASPTLVSPHALFDGEGARNGEPEVQRSGLRNSAPAPALSAVQAIRTVFERFELKYWVTEPLAQRVLDFAMPYLKRDAYATTWDTTAALQLRGRI